MKAQYTAAKASTSAMEGLTGLSENMTDVSMMIDRAQDKITGLQARAAAVSELADSGVLDNLAIGAAAQDDIEAQLKAGSSTSDVDYQLESMKAQLGIGAAATAPTQEVSAASDDSLVIRITGDSVYQVPSSIKPALDALDETLDQAITQNDQDAFSKATDELIKLIHAMGSKLPDTDLRPSDLLVPSQDMTIDQARKMLDEESSSH